MNKPKRGTRTKTSKAKASKKKVQKVAGAFSRTITEKPRKLS